MLKKRKLLNKKLIKKIIWLKRKSRYPRTSMKMVSSVLGNKSAQNGLNNKYWFFVLWIYMSFVSGERREVFYIKLVIK